MNTIVLTMLIQSLNHSPKQPVTLHSLRQAVIYYDTVDKCTDTLRYFLRKKSKANKFKFLKV